MAHTEFLHQLPWELCQDICRCLTGADLKRLSLAGKTCYAMAVPLLWSEVELVDCRTQHWDVADDHDDTPIIAKLLLLATKPSLASHVKVLTHRCHLPPPSIFDELPRMTFDGPTLSNDARTIKLVQLAAAQMKNVHTLRIILGHAVLTDALVRCFFDAGRLRSGHDYERVRKLWLENCMINSVLDGDDGEHPYGLPRRLDFSSLQAVRFRRLPMKLARPVGMDHIHAQHEWNYARGGAQQFMDDGHGGSYLTTIASFERFDLDPHSSPDGDGSPSDSTDRSTWKSLYRIAHALDDEIYSKFGSHQMPPEVMQLGLGPGTESRTFAIHLPGSPSSPSLQKMRRREGVAAPSVAMTMLQHAKNNLTHLNLDWVMTVPSILSISRDEDALERWLAMFRDLFRCRFPVLRSFQLRNCSMSNTVLPEGLYLLDRSTPTFRSALDEPAVAPRTGSVASTLQLAGLSFMEAHGDLQCLAWPMEHFFAPVWTTDRDVVGRVGAVIDRLAETLIDLRVDTLYSGVGEPMSAEDVTISTATRTCRRRFIGEFAARMRKVQSIKIEGGVPRDERREIIRSLHRCSLEKIVMIGVCSPLGNTWGENGTDVGHVAAINGAGGRWLEGEDKAAVHELGTQDPQAPGADFRWQARYGWEGQPPMLHVLASYHADSVRELKFCGFRGSPIVFEPTPITKPMLSALRHFHSLKCIVLGMWLPTDFEGEAQDASILACWRDRETPTTTALVHAGDEEEAQGWGQELQSKYAPEALANRITSWMGPYISERAKQRRRGVNVRASFCVGIEDRSSIFDVDLHIGKNSSNDDVCLGYRGPRTELEGDRRHSKLNGRKWF